jgi:hypothetical protein
MRLFTNLVADVSKNIKATGGKVRKFYVHNTHSAVLYFQLFNDANTPSNSDVPALCVGIPPGDSKLIDERFFDEGMAFATGIAFGTSTTATVYTANGAAKFIVHLHYN